MTSFRANLLALWRVHGGRVRRKKPTLAAHASLHTNQGLGLIASEIIHRRIHFFGAQPIVTYHALMR
jgi:hypothetical protein